MTMQRPPEGALHRAPRPLILWSGAVLAISCLAMVWLLAVNLWPIFQLALQRWAQGEHVDWGGFAVALGALGTFLSVAVTLILQVLSARSRERRDEIAFGAQPTPPFVSPPSSPPPGAPEGGLVNNQAIS